MQNYYFSAKILKVREKSESYLAFAVYYKIALQKVAFKLDISASSGGNPESAG